MPQCAQFGIDLYRKLSAEPGNVFFSPVSVRAALAMTSAGAKGETLKEMQSVLHLPKLRPHAELSDLLENLRSKPRSVNDAKMTFHLANAVWGQKNYPFDPGFLELVKEKYRAEARSLDFSNADAAAGEINAWVEATTDKKISKLVPASAITPATRLILTNAVYFNARWADEFNEASTKEEDFHVTSDKTTRVPTMRRTAEYRYAETPTMHVIQMSYAGFDSAMVILLPKDPDGLAKVEAELSADALSKISSDLKSQRIDLSLPRFKIEQSASLARILPAMGMPLAFDSVKADFSAMGKSEPFFIGDVLHKAFISVDEKGTEAAAATAVMMVAGSAMQKPLEPIRIAVDHPFVFLIQHAETREILFMGRVINPAG